MKTNIIEIIEEIRTTNNLSQGKLAEILNVSQKAISNWQSGNDIPKSDSLIALYENFGITPNQVLGIENDFGIIEHKEQPNKKTQEDIEMQKFWEALEKEYRWKLLGRAAAMLEEQQQRYK